MADELDRMAEQGEEESSPAAALERQMTGQWTAMLQLMTTQGATRQDIMELAAGTARLILTVTGDNLWPTGQAVHPELEEAAMFTSAEGELDALLDYLQSRRANVTEAQDVVEDE